MSVSTGEAKAPRAMRVASLMQGCADGTAGSSEHEGTSGKRLGQPGLAWPSLPIT